MTNQLRDELVALTCDLIAFPSTADRLDHVAAAIDYAERYARAIPGVRVQHIGSNGVPNVIATLRDTKTPAYILNAHLDVVPGRPEQFVPVVRDGRIYGRASQDMKGSAAVLLRLMKDLAALPEPPDVGFQFVGDEEIGGFDGTGHILDQGWRTGFFLAAEPTDLQICYAQKGALWIEAELPGRSSHGSRPWDGLNPIAALRDSLVALEKRFPTPDEAAWVTTVVPTIVSSGDAKNRVPDLVQVTIDSRHIPEESPEEVLAGIQAAFSGGTVRFHSPPSPPLYTDPNDPQIGKLAECIAAVTGEKGRLYREHFASDARFYSNVGIPSVCFGPVGAGLHSEEEWVDIASLEQVYHVLHRFVTT